MSQHITSAFDYVPPIIPSTKPKQRVLLERDIRKLSSDPHVIMHHWPEILDLCHIKKELYNRVSPRAKPTCSRVTKKLAAAIRVFAAAHPDMTLHDIGLLFNVQEARVSEVLHGVRK